MAECIILWFERNPSHREPAGYWRDPMNTNFHASRGASKLGGLGSHSLPLKLYRVAVNGTYMVARILFLLFLNCFEGPASLLFNYVSDTI